MPIYRMVCRMHNEDYLADLNVRDVIKSIHVVSYLDNLVDLNYKNKSLTEFGGDIKET